MVERINTDYVFHSKPSETFFLNPFDANETNYLLSLLLADQKEETIELREKLILDLKGRGK